MDVLWGWESCNGIKEFLTWVDAIVSYFKPTKSNCVSSKLKFLWVEGNAISATQVKSVNRLEKTAF